MTLLTVNTARETGSRLTMKKLRERKAIDALRDLCPAFPQGTIEASEEPDFIVHTDSGNVGIEVTEYFRPETIEGSPLQEQESLCHQIANAATEACVASASPNVYVAVSFERTRRITKRDVAPTAQAIAKLVAQTADDIAWSRRVPNEGQLPEFIDDVIIYRPPGLKEPFVGYTGTTWLPAVSEGRLNETVVAKEKKLEAYRRRCSEVWLLIVIDGFRIASASELPSELTRLRTGFDRIFVMHDWRNVIELSE